MRLGFVGVGKWAQRLAAAFRACGAEIVAYDRRGVQGTPSMVQPLDGFGAYEPWLGMIGRGDINAIVAAAPPDITTEVALACAAAGKPVMATKPLWDHPATIRAPFYVDFWRLFSEFHWEWSLHRERYRTAWVHLEGSGPFREFSGALDYGPHVVAQLFDAWRCYRPVLVGASRSASGEGEEYFAEYRLGDANGEHKAYLFFGNGSAFPRRCVHLSYGSRGEQLVLHEEGTRLGLEEKDAVLQRFCRSFINDIGEGFVDTRLLNLSRDAMAELRKIREMANA